MSKNQKIKTDHQGNYNFVNLAKGSYSIWAVKEGYCQLEMQAIVLADSQSVYLDLGLVKKVEGTTSKIAKIYQGPVYCQNLGQDSLSYQAFRNEYNIVDEIYQGPQIRIAPAPKPSPPMRVERATHYNDNFKAQEKPLRFY